MLAEGIERENNTLVNVANFGVNMTNERLRKMFEKYGPISSYGIMNDNEPWQRFAYVAFEDSDAADEAVIELNGQLIDDNRRMKVRRKRSEKRSKPTSWSGKGSSIKNNDIAGASKDGAGALNDEAGASHVVDKPADSTSWSERYGFSIFVSNLDRQIDRDQLRHVFEAFGELREVKIIMCQVNRTLKSKGFGFVTFAREEDARNAILNMDKRLIGRQVVRVAVSRGKKKPLQQIANNRQRTSSLEADFDELMDGIFL